MKAYKGMDKNMRCREFQYEPGKTYEQESATVCGSGFHSCTAPLDVLRYYGLNNENRFFEVEADGIIAKRENEDSKLASSKLTIGAEIGLPGLIKAHMEYTREKAEENKTAGGNYSNLAGDDFSNLAGGNRSNLAGGNYSNLAGGNRSNLAGGNYSNLAGGNYSNLAGDDFSNLAGDDFSNLAGGNYSNLAGDDFSNLAGGNYSNLAGGDYSAILGRNNCKAKAGLHSIICLSKWEWDENGNYVPVHFNAGIVDGKTLKPDTWYTLKGGEFVEVEE